MKLLKMSQRKMIKYMWIICISLTCWMFASAMLSNIDYRYKAFAMQVAINGMLSIFCGCAGVTLASKAAIKVKGINAIAYNVMYGVTYICAFLVLVSTIVVVTYAVDWVWWIRTLFPVHQNYSLLVANPSL